MEKEQIFTHLAYTKESIEKILYLLSSIPFTGYDSIRTINEVFYLMTNAEFNLTKDQDETDKEV